MRTTSLRRLVATLATIGLITTPALSAAVIGDAAAAPVSVERACDTVTQPRQAACLALVRTDVAARPQASLGPHQIPSGFGYGPDSLQSAYDLPSSSEGGATVAIVDAFDDPNAESDLATYRSDWGLPPCTAASGCFVKVNQDGQAGAPPTDAGHTGWATEISLDLDMVSAACPRCNILLVEANSASVPDLGTGVNTAARLGATAISNSYGASEYQGETADDATFFDHPGIAVTASAGDSGYGVEFPAASQHVVAVGGTSLTRTSDARGWSETVWGGSGSGCSTQEPKPSWQTDSGCAGRTNNDVAAIADPATGVAVYDSYDQGGWLQVGGTSASSPIIAAAYALAGPVEPNTYAAQTIYRHTDSLFDVTGGADGSCSPAYLCTAGTAYDAPTGWGTPNGLDAFGGSFSGNIVNVSNPGDQQGIQDVPFSLQTHASDSAPSESLTFTATGLPQGVSIDKATGLVSGTPTTPGTSSVKVTATDSTGASGSVAFSIVIASPISFTSAGPQSGYLGEPALVQISADDAVAGRTITYSADDLPKGLSIDSSGLISGLPRSSGYHRTTITAHDSASASRSVSLVWYIAPAQAAGPTGPIRLGGGRTCLAETAGKAQLWWCDNRQEQTWTVQPDGSVRSMGKCLTVAHGVQLASCDKTDAQQWRIASYGMLVNPASDKCLTAPASTTANGTLLDVGACTGTAGERWSTPPGPLVSGVTGRCADNGTGTSGHTQVWYCAATNSQAWTAEPDGSIQVAGKCLDARDGTAPCNRGAGQQWRIQPEGTIVNPASGKCLTDPRDNPMVGTQLSISACEMSPGRIWHVA